MHMGTECGFWIVPMRWRGECIGMRVFFFFQAEDGIRDHCVTGVQTCALPILAHDTGSSSSDKITSNPALAGSGDANAVVHFTVDSNPVAGTATANGSGAWSLDRKSVV